MPQSPLSLAPVGSEPVTVALILEQTLLCEFLTDFVGTLPGFEVVATSNNRTEGLDLCERLQPQVAVVELMLAEAAAVSLGAAVKLRSPATHLLVLSTTVQPEWVQEAVAAGVLGFVDTSIDRAALRHALEAVAAGREFFSPRVSSILTDLLRRRAQANNDALLSFRECQVLREIARGRISKEIADTLGLSVFTIENLRRRIMRKTRLHSVAALTLHAMQLGLIGNDPAALPRVG